MTALKVIHNPNYQGENTLKRIIEAAMVKFGAVVAVKRAFSDGEYTLTILRDQPTFPERPYMKIRASISKEAVTECNAVCFYWGHYDLTAKEAGME